MHRQRSYEMARCYMLFRSQFMLYIQPLWEQHLRMGDFDMLKPTKQLYWDDASKTVGYVQQIIGKVSKYGT